MIALRVSGEISRTMEAALQKSLSRPNNQLGEDAQGPSIAAFSERKRVVTRLSNA